MAAGDFTASTLPQFKYAIDRVLRNSLARQRAEEEVAFINAVITQDNSQIDRLMSQSNNQCQGIKIYWLKEYKPTATMSTPTNWVDPICDFTGTQQESTSQDISGIKLFDVSFEVEDNACPNLIEKVELIANGQAGCLQALRRQINAYALTKVAAAVGEQKYTATGDFINFTTTANAGLLTKLNPGNLNHIDFIPYWQNMMAWNRFDDVAVIDGSCFAKVMSNNRLLDGTMKEDTNQSEMDGIFPKYFRDMKFMAANSLSTSFFALQAGAMAAVFHNNFGMNPVEYSPNGGVKQMQYAIPLGLTDRLGNQIMVDVQYKETSVSNADSKTCHLKHTWSYSVRHNVYQNPNLGDGRTGVLKYTLDNTVTKLTNPFTPTWS